MRTHPILLLAVGLSLSACDDPGGPSTGTLVVSTATGGNDPDPDGYLLTVGPADSLALDPTGTAEVDLPAGRYTLRLLGVAEHCSVAPGTHLEVDIASRSTTPVAFEVNCPAIGARITTTTTGLDMDPDGYRIAVDGTDRHTIPSNSTLLIRVDPGSRTIALTGLASNCAVDGPGSRTVIIVEAEVAPIEFAVVCTATSGVIGVVISGSGTGAVLEATVDGATPFPVGLGGPAYLVGVPAGDHVVSLSVPAGCSVETDSQSVTVTAGSLIRDTVEVTFSVACVASLRITAPTTGTIPQEKYSVWLCGRDPYYCIYGGPRTRLGRLAPNGILLAEVGPNILRLYLTDLPSNCRVGVPNPTRELTLAPGDTLDVEFPVACSP